MLRHAFIVASFCCALIISPFASAESTSQPNEQINLFALPLKEVLEIRVDGGNSSLTSAHHVTIYDRERFSSELRSVEVKDRTVLKARSLLLVDGHSIELLASLDKVEDYLSHFGPEVKRIEVYKGRYTRYFSSRRVRSVINIVTATANSEEASQ